MKINFNPQRSDADLIVSVSGDIVVINGDAFDFSAIPDGATLTSSAVSGSNFSGDISRINGEIELSVILPHKENAPTSITFPASVLITSGDLIDTTNNSYPWGGTP